jgi:hypothetical protein
MTLKVTQSCSIDQWRHSGRLRAASGNLCFYDDQLSRIIHNLVRRTHVSSVRLDVKFGRMGKHCLSPYVDYDLEFLLSDCYD